MTCRDVYRIFSDALNERKERVIQKAGCVQRITNPKHKGEDIPQAEREIFLSKNSKITWSSSPYDNQGGLTAQNVRKMVPIRHTGIYESHLDIRHGHRTRHQIILETTNLLLLLCLFFGSVSSSSGRSSILSTLLVEEGELCLERREETMLYLYFLFGSLCYQTS